MKLFTTRIEALTFATLSLALCFGVVPAAKAMSMFDASMAVDLKLTGVTDDQSNDVSTGWTATALGSIFDDSIILVGDGTGDNYFEISPDVTLQIGGSFAQQVSEAMGQATDGKATVYGWTDLTLSLVNSTSSSLIFSFEVKSTGSASATGIAQPYAQVALLSASRNLLQEFDTIAPDTLPQPSEVTSNFQVTVAANSGDTRYITVDTYGEIPIPASITLLISGFVGLLAARRRKRTT